jgi:hypothetical protein
MTILQKLRQSVGHAGKRRSQLGDADVAVRHTDVWEHETFAEEQARWERSDPEYARLCQEVRQAREKGGEASRRADEAKAEWDARVGPRRQASDDARRARTLRLVIRDREGHHHMHTTVAIESIGSPAPGIMPEAVDVHDEPGERTAPPDDRQAPRLCVRGPAGGTPVSDKPTKLEVV